MPYHLRFRQQLLGESPALHPRGSHHPAFAEEMLFVQGDPFIAFLLSKKFYHNTE